MDQEVKAPEPFDLNQRLSQAYEQWASQYIGKDHEVYTPRLCRVAFAEGARAIQAMLQAEYTKIFPEQQP
jgi:hypothetical protein